MCIRDRHNRLDGTYKASELDEDMDEIDELIKQKILFAPMVDNYQLAVSCLLYTSWADPVPGKGSELLH